MKTNRQNRWRQCVGATLFLLHCSLVAAFAQAQQPGESFRRVTGKAFPHALRLCEARGLAKDEVLYVGDDYGPGGNDESVLLTGFPFLRIDDYRATPAALRARLLGAD